MKQPAQSERGPNAIPPCLNRLNDAPPYFIPPREGPRMPNAQAPPRPTAGFTKTQYMDTLPRPEPSLGLAFRQANLWPCFTARASSRASCVTNQRRASTARIRIMAVPSYFCQRVPFEKSESNYFAGAKIANNGLSGPAAGTERLRNISIDCLWAS